MLGSTVRVAYSPSVGYSAGMSACAHRDQVNFSRPKFLDGVELVSVAYRDRAFPTHTHDCFVVGTVVAGAEELDVWGSRRVVSVGDVIQLNPDQPHSNRTVGSETLKYRVFYLSPASVSKSTNPGGSRTLSFGLPVVSDSQARAEVGQYPRIPLR